MPTPILAFAVMPSAVGFAAAAACSLAASAVAVSRLERVAVALGLPEIMLGLLVAVAADAPEITSAVTALARHQTDIGAGVTLGSNVFNLAALLGLSALVAGRITLHRRVVLLEGVPAFTVAAITVVVLATGVAPVAGLVAVAVVSGVYLLISAAPPALLRRIGFSPGAVSWLRAAVVEEELELAVAVEGGGRARRTDLPVAVAAIVVVVAASAVMERSAQALGGHYHVSGLVVGGVVLAAVTSLPNAVGAVYLARRGKGQALLSEALNSNMINVLAGLFLPATITGLATGGGDGVLVAGWYAVLTAVSLTLVWAGRGLSRRAAWCIVAGYVAFVAVAVAR